MVLNTRLEHAPVRVFQPKIGDVSHFLCTHLVESDAASRPRGDPAAPSSGSSRVGLKTSPCAGFLRALVAKPVFCHNPEFFKKNWPNSAAFYLRAN